MVIITISNLQHPNSHENMLVELTTWEMKTIDGGIRRTKTFNGDTSNILSTDELTKMINDWLNNVDRQISDLRIQLSN